MQFHAVVYLLVVNCWCLFSFFIDKARAQNNRRRIPEANLLGLALMDGTIGAFAGRHFFRHKIRKQPFSFHLQLIAMVRIGLIVGLFFIFIIG